MNDPDKTKLAVQVAREVAGTANVLDDVPPAMGAEDFAHMLKERPGAYILIGNGPGPGLHTPGYNFNDAALPFGISYLARLAETGHAGLRSMPRAVRARDALSPRACPGSSSPIA